MKILYPGCRCRIVFAPLRPEVLGSECTLLWRVEDAPGFWELNIDGFGCGYQAHGSSLEPILHNFGFTAETTDTDIPVAA